MSCSSHTYVSISESMVGDGESMTGLLWKAIGELELKQKLLLFVNLITRAISFLGVKW